MFPLQPKVCLFIQNQRTNNKAFKTKENNIKALKKNIIIYVQGKKKRKENVCPPLKIFNQPG